MSAISKEYLQTILQEVASVVNIQYWEYTQEDFENISQNYFGIIIPVVLTGERNERKLTIPLVLKLAPTDERYRVSGAITYFFHREIFAYNVLFKSYKEVQASFPLHLRFITPRCYYVQEEYCKEAIVMENMVKDGYKPYTHAMFLDLNHIIVSLKSLAVLHGLSFITQHNNPEFYKIISETCVPLTEKTGPRYMSIMRDRLDKAMHKFEATEYIPLLKRLKDDCARLIESVVTKVKTTCICHGDIWKENILYKYKENNQPISACLIDYQSARLSCAAFDTLYLIISSINTELRQEHYHQLLDIYYQILDEVLKEAGLVSQEIYSRQMFDHDLKIVAPACIITANCALWLSNGLQEEGHVRSKIILTTPEDKERAVNKEQRNCKSYHR